MTYIVAHLGINLDKTWTVTYYGDVPEQGGLSVKRGQLTFIKLGDACIFLERELGKQTDHYLDLISKKLPDNDRE